MKQSSQPTLNDVAQKAAVSTATVSRVINAPESVKEKTRHKVQEAIEQLGYAPNFSAQALAAKRTKIIGAIIPTMENAIFAQGLQAFQTALSYHGYTLLVSSSNYQHDIENEQIRNLVSRGVDGLLLIGEERDHEIYDYLKKRDIPYVLAWNFKQNSEHLFVGFDNHAAAKIMAQKVIDYGHRHVGILAGITQDNDRARDRLNGFCEAFAHNGLTLPQNAIIEVAYNIEKAGEAFMALYKQHPDITAVICGNDVIGVGAMRCAQQQNLRIPDDISFVGFDDIQISEIISPGLTTMHVPHRQMGQHAASLLLTVLKESIIPESLQLTAHIIERGSLKKIEPTQSLSSRLLSRMHLK